MNTELLLKVRDAILAEPLKFDMEMWFKGDERSPRGTTACIGGWAVAIELSGGRLKIAREKFYGEIIMPELLLDIDDNQATRLFFVNHWPSAFYNSYTGANRSDAALAAADRITHFIATNGAE